MVEPRETVSMICFWACKENPFIAGAVFDLSSDRETY
ncbi:hypothetical protein BOA8489_02108 [Boseongicola aestuarii]|jgi:hypothetical protein|uniref:Uncharacterized protein n=1 Tax=Boseongicola aestuarii TaxID=1470561 RepID=A0A238J261_9RHOB|nr:hypothetical protein BOA8489_02108 [Boseongicola aestuarii]